MIEPESLEALSELFYLYRLEDSGIEDNGILILGKRIPFVEIDDITIFPPKVLVELRGHYRLEADLYNRTYRMYRVGWHYTKPL